ncbi:CPBP family intramembrane glutamic endopeptidase [Tunturiibacter gelidiferens]|uniref:CPBP family intramembrane glutamic endopeptidase n=1 Tax=Tunturiibacter gelidiferens TaxID=3069689 RepID=UPI003D9B94BB
MIEKSSTLRDQDPPALSSRQRRFVLLSPILLIAAGHLTARVFSASIGAWAWVPLQLVYWSGMIAVLYSVNGLSNIFAAYKRSSGWRSWSSGILIGLIPWPILLLHLSLLHSPLLIVCWIALALINPFIEESYWRGLFGEVTARWPAWAALLYPTLFFAAAHPLQWGVFSVGSRNWQMVVALMIMGIAWSATYRQTRSLRSNTFSHMLVDLGNMSVWVFLNLYIPPTRH